MSNPIQIKSLMKKINLIVMVAILFASCGEKSLTSYVNPMVGTDGHGHTFPGAIVPFGMIQPSPDTRLDGWGRRAADAGRRAAASRIEIVGT